ncbi:MAG TPA: TIGR02281 family clan AA aspartic protease [Accumulibacter sp.]|nr:TIGR02281 family clan AA aspartic protease [Accumulibacter sp.]HMW17763.1 TIGR02281 family clan AA aspartic protease [Accumulibacter sp.]HMX22529.1 TIGR02281 family clan AA aspartic protease [Accumulibacter sp.]HMY05648.1 TIGR02281 family clan AA aspartic protease [Accumulibacter sp.]HNC17905.1 TIGR02281 family clan AA aspartic protease [Accumulibacter sp.]
MMSKKWYSWCAVCLFGVSSSSVAVEVGLAGVFPGKALLTIDGGGVKTVAVGTRSEEGIRVLAVDSESATIEVDGKKRTLRVGQNVKSQAASVSGATAVLTADNNGHFLTTGTVNGTSVRFLVDTGATLIALSAADARRIGLDPRKGQPVIVNTANGQAQVSKVRLDTVRIGELVVNGVDAVVHPQDLPINLLGMSFLNRMEMQRDGQTMTLKQRF